MIDTSSKLESALAEIRELTAWQLAGRADCGQPDSLESAGAALLTSVRDGFIEAIEYDFADDDTIENVIDRDRDRGILSELADGAPDIYTYTMWQEFVDLAAYHEDPTELGADGSDMEKSARGCLYIIAERLVESLAAEAIEAWSNLDEDS